MIEGLNVKDENENIFYVELEQGYRYITKRGDWVILSKHTNDEPGAKFMHLTLIDKDTYLKAKTYSEKQRDLEDLMDRATEHEARQSLNDNRKEWEDD